MIHASKLSKHFFIRKSQQGAWAQFRHFFGGERLCVKAVDGISFDIAQGELLAYLGPNGAGKSTTIKMLSGLLLPSGGELEVAGFRPYQERRSYVQHIGVVFGQRSSLWWDLAVIDSLKILKHIYKLSDNTFEERLGMFGELLELAPFLHTPVRSLSLGQRMRADLAAALLHQPKLLFLDEPTIGLDVVAKERIRRLIKELNQQTKTTVLLTTHDLADVQKLCQRVMVIDRGRLLYDGSLQDLLDSYGAKRKLVVDFAEEYRALELSQAQLLSHHNGRAHFAFDSQRSSASAVITELSRRYAIRDLSIEEPDIEETIRNIYEKELLLKGESDG